MHYTIKDIARQAGVSKSTVSRYIRGERDKISPSTQRIVSKVIQELDYRPNQVAVGLARGQMPTVGVIVSDISNPFSSVFMKGIFDACEERGQSTAFAISDGSIKRERDIIKNFRSSSVDRLIIQTCGDNEKFLSKLDPRKTVFIDRPLKKEMFSTVTSDNYDSTLHAIHYLQDQGCTPIAFITLDIKSVTTRSIRCDAYLDAVEGQQEPIVVSFDAMDEAETRLTQLFSSSNRPKGIFTSNGEALKIFLKFARKHDIAIGRDIGVISFEDWDWMEFLNPAITAVRQDSYTMGYVSAKTLLEGGTPIGGKPETRIIQSKLVVRDSTDLR
ncbi:LacI family DNA-binding transcriptional regulator [Bifidobacterium sp. ESL0732]|uniref:LacI family DNA-binding transcriptional regulator n=1 Tax=Bifidobacterium sp. ESL0732 TaxID=2983222 RepID=UPI0023F68006|nr:LacI family DNA-binding transcriptional regulator [Bifidobacterium sp. ESL0732]WEV63427.1 LacI family DNA-binding transcriptional regulator [Bifidobacterium sp. ESL0732]